MALVRYKDTKPELRVRRLVHALGYRYRLHARELPGRPDLVFPRLKKVIFVHGCYWHRHEGCPRTRLPKSRLEFWAPKLEANARRDVETRARLAALGWRVLVVWECESERPKELKRRLRQFLGPRLSEKR